MNQLRWVQLLRDQSSDLEAALPAAVAPGLLEEALYLVPPSFTCPLLRILDEDLQRHFTSGDTGELSQFDYFLDEETLRMAQGHIQTARKMLKELSAFFQPYEDIKCTCAECDLHAHPAKSRALNKNNSKKRLRGPYHLRVAVAASCSSSQLKLGAQERAHVLPSG